MAEPTTGRGLPYCLPRCRQDKVKNIAKKWTMPIKDWKSALNQFSIIFGDRMLNF